VPKDHYGVRGPDEVLINATNNYWGHKSGPYNGLSNPNGEGCCVSNNVVFFPWYVDEGMSEVSPYEKGIINARDLSSYKSIQAAINAAQPGDTIFVSEGTYTVVDLTIDKNLTLEATDGLDATTISGNITITAGGATIEGFTIDGEVEGPSVTIINDIFEKNTFAQESIVLELVDGTAKIVPATEVSVINVEQGRGYYTIQAAIDAYENAENGDYTIIIKDGTYNEDGIVIKQQVGKSLTIKSESEHGAILVNDSSVDSTGIFHVSGGSNYDTGAVTFEGIRFELPAGDEVNCFGIKLLSGTEDRYASNVTVRNCEFIGSVEKSCAVYSASHSSPKDILIEGCNGDGLTALYNGYGSGITIKDSELTNARGLLNSQSTDSTNELVIDNVEASIAYEPSKDMDAIKINGGHLTVKDSNITLYYNGANRSSGLIVIRGGATIVINNSTLTANKVGGDYDVYTFYGMNPANRSNTVFGGDIEDFTYGGTFEQVEL
jgi:hypothetical protein